MAKRDVGCEFMLVFLVVVFIARWTYYHWLLP